MNADKMPLFPVLEDETTMIAVSPLGYHWAVFVINTVKELAHGHTDTLEQAFRDARNFIRHNQNAVFTAVSDEAAVAA